ncbi:MAG: putative Ig domain-containing protein, partial [Burkholderiaceae bacterium]|nr:putative Ig domain-containing protein [Burkholderiaceae bacterium]
MRSHPHVQCATTSKAWWRAERCLPAPGNFLRFFLAGAASVCGLFFLTCATPASAADWTVERVSLFASRGGALAENRRVPAAAGSLASTGVEVVDFVQSTPSSNRTEWKWRLRNVSGTVLDGLRLTGLIDVDISAPANTYFNETAVPLALTAPAEHVAADRWEIGEPGYFTGMLLARAAQGELRNVVNLPAQGDDVALALSAVPGTLDPDQEVTAWLILDQTAAEGLQQKDAANGLTQNIQFYLYKNPVPITTYLADYAVTIVPDTPTVQVGEQVEFTIEVTNLGLTDGTGATLTGTVPAQIVGVTWSCVAQGAAACLTPAGSGSALSVRGLAPASAGGKLIITVRGTGVTNATVDLPVTVAPTHADTVDANLGNNTDSATVVISSGSTAQADLEITKTTPTPIVRVNQQAQFDIVAINHGPNDAPQARLSDVVPAEFTGVTWTCTATGGAQCPVASGNGSDIDLTTDMPVGSMVNVQVKGTLTQAKSNVLNTASIASKVSDPDPGNNTSSASINATAATAAAPQPIPSLEWSALIVLSLLTALLGWGQLAWRGNARRFWRSVLPGGIVAWFLLLPGQSHAIFVNGNFETQNFDGWTRRYGTNPGLGGSPPFQVSDVRISAGGVGKTTIVGSRFDPRAPQLVLPRQGNFSAKVNDEDNSYHLNEISQKAIIAESDRDPGDGKLHVRFSYAAVLEDPNHTPTEQPYFFVELQDLTQGETLYYDFAFSNQPGRLFYTTVVGGSKWMSTPFIDVDMVVPDSSLGHELQIRVVGADCSLGAHGGYVYVDAFGSVSIPPQGACIPDLKARSKPGNVQLTWSDTGAASYAVYRADKLEGPYIRLGTTQSRYSTWLDRTVQAGHIYYYSVRTLDAEDHELCSSGEIATVVPEHWSIGDPVNRPPVFTSTPVLSGDIRAPYEYQALAEDADGDALTYRLLYAPVGMAVDAATGKIDWQPDLMGDYRVNLQVADPSGLLASQAFSIHVVDGNLPPTITSQFPSKVPAGVNYAHQVQATDPEKGPLQYTVGSQATGLTIDASGRITWTNPQPGTYPLTIQVTDQYGARDVQQVVVAVQAFPEFTSLPVVTATTGQPYTYPASASDKDSDTLTYGVEAGPAGLIIDPNTGVVSWPAPVTGNVTVTLTVVDPDGNTGRQTYTLRVTATPNRAPVFTATPVTYVAYPAAYAYTATATDADGDNLLWKLLQAPPGMTINERTGAIAWKFTSDVTGKFPVRVQVDDRRGGVAEQSFEVQVPVYGNGAPSITSRPASQVRAGLVYSYTVTATDPENDPLTYRLVQGPAAAALNGNQLTWQTSAADVGIHELAIEVADTAGNTTQQSWQLEVVPASTNRPPVITSAPRVTATAGAPYEYQVVASDADGDPLTYVLLTAPTGMTISAAGKVEWAVPAGMAGSEAVEIKASDGRGGEVTQAYAIGVGITANRPPLINSTPAVTATAGATYKYQVSATDPDGDVLSYAVSTAAPDITIDAATGLVSWPVPAGVTGQAELMVMVTDGKGGVATQTWTIGVGQAGNRPPRITTQPGTTGVSGGTYTYALRATDADGDTLTYALLEFPQGMTIASAIGDIGWSIPDNVAGMASVLVEVSDGKGGLATQGYAISVSGASNRAPAFTSTPATLATAGVAYTYAAKATDPDGDAVTYSLETAPDGMTINAQTGAVAWTPTLQQGGNQAVAVRAADTKGAWVTQNFDVYVQLPANSPPQITSKPVQRWAPGVPYQYQVVATDPDKDVLTYSLEAGPAGMTLSAATGLLVWNNPLPGTYSVEIKVQDARGAYAVQSYGLLIAANRDPVITSVPVPSGTVGAPYTYQVAASDPDGDFLTYKMTGAPATLTISDTGLISGTPAAVGTYTVVVTVSDGQVNVTQTWTLRITEAAAAGPLQASVTPTPKYLNLGETVTLQVFAEGGTAPYTVTSLTVKGAAVAVDASNKATYTPTAIGKYAVRLTLRDAKNATVTVDEWFAVKDPSDTTAPLAIITAPGDSSDITVTDVWAPTAIMGTASDANLAEYVLLLSPSGKNQWSALGGGTASVAAGKLGDLNPQTLANGLYDIGLIARDISGNESSAKVTVAITGEQKTAPLQLTFTDLSFDVEGLPLTVRRTYDSLKRAQRMDFGYGWTVDYQDVWLQTNGVLGRSWVMVNVGSGFNRQLCVRPQGARVASVRLPGGQLEQFELRASPECTNVLAWTGSVDIVFTPKASNKSGSKLQALGYSDLGVAGNDLIDMGAVETFDPSQYKLTLLDGTEYILGRDLGIQQIKDRNGNTLQFTRNGITNSSGWSLAFTRDAQGKITKITGPGNQTMVYSYDGAENLTTVMDQSNAVSDFRYENAKVPHGLTSYSDPLGRLALKTTYDDAGRILTQTDALGRVVNVATDNNAQKQTVKDRNGNTTVYEFDERGNITQVTDAAGGITQYAYDAADNEIEVTDPLGRKTVRTYDPYGNVTSETGPDGRKTQTAYNAFGNVTTVTDPAGRVTTNGY